MNAQAAAGPDDIRWLEGEAAAPRAIACPVCGDARPHEALLAVRSMAAPHAELTFLRCDACGSGHYDPPGVIDFSELGHAGIGFWRFYVEVGGGVWETIWPVLAAQGPAGRSMLDIGCGFGFAVDFWRRQVGGEAVGVELAEYGRLGARHLGITIHDRLLQDIRELDGRTFDVVYASEVVEHVPDPGAFVALLARYVAGDGVLVLTTPAMSYVTRAHQSPALHAALAPGFHGFLLSREAFARAARDAGFAHVDVRVFDERQILWASRRPLAVETAPAKLRPAYYAYLDGRVAEGDTRSPVWQGLAYRALKDRVNTGRAAEVRGLAHRLLDAAASTYGEHLRDPQATAARIAASRDVEAMGAVAPYFVPNLYYHLGMIALQADRDAAAGIRWLEGSLACIDGAVALNGTLFLEAMALVGSARVMLGEVRMALGDVGGGADVLARLCRESEAPSAADADLIERRATANAAMLAERGHPAAARAILAGYADYVARRYGEPLLRADGVEAALAARDATPADPMVAPWLAALIDLAERRPDAAARAQAVVAAAERLASHPAHGPRMREQAAVLRRRLQAASSGPRTAWSSPTTFRPPS